ncbi:hypothetical protein GYMLUDRAFT_76710 [Collybiopsis luxurians FD-317 M1]|uniref:Fanconi-associated nuclease n=1 Tax=Collybiopsis luxurians FD-317 M1 TaxID=944289 RepID=A0A0D0CAU7_9AGAR|nr:hypothetical protein GYMLUDRAFT_76710 [Collybiopsis luxurians FD-317 M1]
MNTLTTQLIFGSQRVIETEEDLTALLDDSDPKQTETNDSETVVPRIVARNNDPSPYVSVFEGIVNQVWDYEDHLMTEDEKNAILAFRKLSYPTRYILIRLSLRMPGWHTRKTLEKYISEVGPEGIDKAMKELCLSVVDMQKLDSEEVKQEEQEIIDLTIESEDEGQSNSAPSSRPQNRARDVSPSPHNPAESILSYLCKNGTHMTLDEILFRLSAPGLKAIAKNFKIKIKSKSPTKEDLIGALKSTSRSQVNILTMLGKRKTPSDSGPAASSSVTQEGRLKRMASEKLGPCIQVNQDLHQLLRKIHIIFYRSTSIPKTLFLDSYLTHFNKREYPPYTWSRSIIWQTIEDYQLYEEALDLQELIDSILDETFVQPKEFTPEKTSGLKTRFRTPVTPVRDLATRQSTAPPSVRKATPVKEEEGDVKLTADETGAGIEYEIVDLAPTLGNDFKFNHGDEEGGAKRASPEKLRQAARIVDIYHKTLRRKWDLCLSVALVKFEKERDASLERFEQGYILARLLGKVAEAYALLHEFEEELKILESLIEQRFWRAAKRGKWYERRALVKDHHLPKALKLQAEQNGWTKEHLALRKKEVWEQTRQNLYEALEDEDTHRVYRKSLVGRLDKLEKRLNIAGEDRHQYTEQLRKAYEVVVFAYRAERSFSKPNEEPYKWKGKQKEDITAFLIRPRMPANSEDEPEDSSAGLPRFPSSTGKSVWKTIDGADTCNVEQRALQYYASEEGGGYQGLHSETCILTTVFGLLFWDILFANVPGAFETKFQIAPLDLMEDSFHDSRKDSINARLEELRNGKALEILNRHDTQYRANKTWCVGVNWDVCDKEQLAQIVECMSGETLAVICDLFCHDYAARASGVPDLIVWNHEERKCKFVEVKGPGDRARDNQTLWFDTLLGAGLEVDLCRIQEDNTKNRNKERERLDKLRAKAAQEEKTRVKQEAKAGRKRKVAQRKKKKPPKEEPESEDEELSMNAGRDDDDDYRGPENLKMDVDGDDLSTQTKEKRRRQDEDTEGFGHSDHDSRCVLAESQEKVASQEDGGWSANSVVTIPSPKRRKMDREPS